MNEFSAMRRPLFIWWSVLKPLLKENQLKKYQKTVFYKFLLLSRNLI